MNVLLWFRSQARPRRVFKYMIEAMVERPEDPDDPVTIDTRGERDAVSLYSQDSNRRGLNDAGRARGGGINKGMKLTKHWRKAELRSLSPVLGIYRE